MCSPHTMCGHLPGISYDAIRANSLPLRLHYLCEATDLAAPFDDALGGGWIRTYGSHIVDMLRWLLDAEIAEAMRSAGSR